jgi:hypothetical protein
LTLPFLPLAPPFPEEYFGRVIPAPRVTGANSSFAVSFRSFSGDEKSILNASFFSRLGLEEAAAASVMSAKQIAVESKI